MAGFVFLLLPLSILAVFACAALAVADVAFRGMRVAPGGIGIDHAPRREMRAISTTGRSTTWELVSTLRELAGETAETTRQKTCERESFVPMVTEQEARSIADELRLRGGDELRQVLARSQERGVSCPMRTETGICACGIARPLSCIGRCTLGGDSPEWVAGLGDSVSEAFRHHLESRHMNAETRRLDDALVLLLDRPCGNAV